MKLSSIDKNAIIKQAVSLIRVSNEFLEIDAIDEAYNDETDTLVNKCHGHLVCSMTMMLKSAGMTEEQIDGFIDLHSQKPQ